VSNNRTEPVRAGVRESENTPQVLSPLVSHPPTCSRVSSASQPEFELFTFFAFSFPRHQLLFTTREEDWDLVKAKGTCHSNSRL